MKVKLSEQQIKNLVNKLSPVNIPQIDTGELETIAPHLSKLGKLLNLNKSTDITKINSTDDNVQFASYIPTGGEMVHPLGHKSSITSGFGFRNSSIGTSNHKGIDISTKSGTPVYAPLDGVVIRSEDTTPNRCGGHIRLDHNNIETKFCHLRQMIVKRGDKVKKGQLIGYSGGGVNDPMRGTATGPHLHYEILNKSGIAMNPTTIQHNLAENVK